MSIFKCKMCGGTIEFEPGTSVGVCDHCGTKQTLPRLDDDRRANLYDRADHFRRNNDFDKAAGIYETLLNDDKTDAEVYWLTVLCRYGVEYVEDPATHKRIPTVNRAQYTSIFDDADYRSALEYADAQQRAIYESEATSINEIQKGILAISQKEEPFDVFICYKETDAQGRRTPDSVLANDLYHQLVNEGFKVFFSRITLEDKLGTAYEPYIFAALNSAKVMVALGTKPEYFNAVWVKNEWSRFLALVKASNGKKVLIPAYRDMDPYDLPEEFSHLQAQDMSKLGFMQDLIRGIKKIAKADEPKATVKETVVVGGTGNANAAPLLKRAFMFLEDGEWAKADDFCEQVLNLDPENAQAYLGKLMAEQRVRRQEDLANCEQPFDNSNNYQKAMRFGDENLKQELESAITNINEHRRTMRYDEAVSAMNHADTEDSYKKAAEAFKTIPHFKDSDELAEKCLDRAETCKKDAIYDSAISHMSKDKKEDYEKAVSYFETIAGWKDSDAKIVICRDKIEEINKQNEIVRIEAERISKEKRIAAQKAAKKRKKIITISTLIISSIIVFIIVLTTVILPANKLKSQISILSNAQIGSYAYFGSYEQDNNTSNGKEDIEWVVLAKEENKVLLISRYSLDCQPYQSKSMWFHGEQVWGNCSIRTWLNTTFYNAAFNSVEQQRIPSTTLAFERNPADFAYYKDEDLAPEKSTTDNVFLLSITEAKKYFVSDTARQCTPTAYASALGAGESWWLRSPTDTEIGGFSSVMSSGEIMDSFGYCTRTCAIRPAMWIDLGS